MEEIYFGICYPKICYHPSGFPLHRRCGFFSLFLPLLLPMLFFLFIDTSSIRSVFSLRICNALLVQVIIIYQSPVKSAWFFIQTFFVQHQLDLCHWDNIFLKMKKGCHFCKVSCAIVSCTSLYGIQRIGGFFLEEWLFRFIHTHTILFF